MTTRSRQPASIGNAATPSDSKEPSTRPVKRSFAIAGHKTSISLEAAFWQALQEAAKEEAIAVATLVARIDRERGATNLSSAIRVWLFERARAGTASGDKGP